MSFFGLGGYFGADSGTFPVQEPKRRPSKQLFPQNDLPGALPMTCGQADVTPGWVWLVLFMERLYRVSGGGLFSV